jgi:hypothetical protein
VITNDVGYYLHKFTGKKEIATQKLNSHHCKEQLRKFSYFARMRNGEFNIGVAVTLLPINLCNRSHHLQ